MATEFFENFAPATPPTEHLALADSENTAALKPKSKKKQEETQLQHIVAGATPPHEEKEAPAPEVPASRRSGSSARNSNSEAEPLSLVGLVASDQTSKETKSIAPPAVASTDNSSHAPPDIPAGRSGNPGEVPDPPKVKRSEAEDRPLPNDKPLPCTEVLNSSLATILTNVTEASDSPVHRHDAASFSALPSPNPALNDLGNSAGQSPKPTDEPKRNTIDATTRTTDATPLSSSSSEQTDGRASQPSPTSAIVAQESTSTKPVKEIVAGTSNGTKSNDGGTPREILPELAGGAGNAQPQQNNQLSTRNNLDGSGSSGTSGDSIKNPDGTAANLLFTDMSTVAPFHRHSAESTTDIATSQATVVNRDVGQSGTRSDGSVLPSSVSADSTPKSFSGPSSRTTSYGGDQSEQSPSSIGTQVERLRSNQPVDQPLSAPTMIPAATPDVVPSNPPARKTVPSSSDSTPATGNMSALLNNPQSAVDAVSHRSPTTGEKLSDLQPIQPDQPVQLVQQPVQSVIAGGLTSASSGMANGGGGSSESRSLDDASRSTPEAVRRSSNVPSSSSNFSDPVPKVGGDLGTRIGSGQPEEQSLSQPGFTSAAPSDIVQSRQPATKTIPSTSDSTPTSTVISANLLNNVQMANDATTHRSSTPAEKLNDLQPIQPVQAVTSGSLLTGSTVSSGGTSSGTKTGDDGSRAVEPVKRIIESSPPSSTNGEQSPRTSGDANRTAPSSTDATLANAGISANLLNNVQTATDAATHRSSTPSEKLSDLQPVPIDPSRRLVEPATSSFPAGDANARSVSDAGAKSLTTGGDLSQQVPPSIVGASTISQSRPGVQAEQSNLSADKPSLPGSAATQRTDIPSTVAPTGTPRTDIPSTVAPTGTPRTDIPSTVAPTGTLSPPGAVGSPPADVLNANTSSGAPRDTASSVPASGTQRPDVSSITAPSTTALFDLPMPAFSSTIVRPDAPTQPGNVSNRLDTPTQSGNVSNRLDTPMPLSTGTSRIEIPVILGPNGLPHLDLTQVTGIIGTPRVDVQIIVGPSLIQRPDAPSASGSGATPHTDHLILLGPNGTARMDTPNSAATNGTQRAEVPNTAPISGTQRAEVLNTAAISGTPRAEIPNSIATNWTTRVEIPNGLTTNWTQKTDTPSPAPAIGTARTEVTIIPGSNGSIRTENNPTIVPPIARIEPIILGPNGMPRVEPVVRTSIDPSAGNKQDVQIVRHIEQPIRVIDPSTLNPGAINPSTLNPGAINPSTLNPGAINSSTLNPGVVNPGHPADQVAGNQSRTLEPNKATDLSPSHIADTTLVPRPLDSGSTPVRPVDLSIRPNEVVRTPDAIRVDQSTAVKVDGNTPGRIPAIEPTIKTPDGVVSDAAKSEPGARGIIPTPNLIDGKADLAAGNKPGIIPGAPRSALPGTVVPGKTVINPAGTANANQLTNPNQRPDHLTAADETTKLAEILWLTDIGRDKHSSVLELPSIRQVVGISEFLKFIEKTSDDQASEIGKSTSGLAKNAPQYRTRYTVQRGDTLESIAVRKLGDARFATLILTINRANIQVVQENSQQIAILLPGQSIWLPTAEELDVHRKYYFSSKIKSTQATTTNSNQTPIVMNVSSHDRTSVNLSKGGPSSNQRPAGKGASDNNDCCPAASSASPLGQALNQIRSAGRKAVSLDDLDHSIDPICERRCYQVRLGETLQSVALRDPLMNDVHLWVLLARINGLPTEGDQHGKPLVQLQRGQYLVLPTEREIAQFRLLNKMSVATATVFGANDTVVLETPPAQPHEEKQELSHFCRVVLSNGSGTGAQFMIKLQADIMRQWVTIASYESRSGCTQRIVFRADGSRNHLSVELPTEVARQLAQEDFRRNWHLYYNSYMNHMSTTK